MRETLMKQSYLSRLALLLGIALSNSWQLVISHEAGPEPEDSD